MPICNEEERNNEDETGVFFLFDGSGRLSWRTFIKMTPSLFSTGQTTSLKILTIVEIYSLNM